MKFINFSFQIIFILFFLFIGCSKDKKKWENSKQINSIESYQKFIHEFPESEYAALAKNKIDSIAYENACNENSEESYLKYYETYPNSIFAKESRDKAASIAFENLKNENVESAFLEFINKYTGSLYEEEAKNIAANLQYKRIKSENNIEVFKRFISDYPESDKIEKVKIIIDDLQNYRRYWSEKDFKDKLKNISSKELAASKKSKYKFILIDGGNEMTMHRDGPRGISSLRLFYFEERDKDTVESAHLAAILYKEGMVPYGGVGIGEIFFWHRSLRVFFFDEGTPSKFQDKLYKLHLTKSKKHKKNNRKVPFSIICTIAGK